MHRLASAAEKQLLQQLSKYIEEGHLTPNYAWNCLSQPDTNKKFGKKNPIEIVFTDANVADLQNLKHKVTRRLEERSRRCCSYCKRPVGKHGYGWHIEHVMCKSKNPKLTFDMNNLVLACIDCNMIKNHSVDRKSDPYNIINPSAANFDYAKHLSFTLLSTEDFCLLKYIGISDEGKETYRKLKFDTLERMELLSSIPSPRSDRIRGLSDAASELAATSAENTLAEFYAELKQKLCSL
jgi:uncharacterized protein (TIGR02646 family)